MPQIAKESQPQPQPPTRMMSQYANFLLTVTKNITDLLFVTAYYGLFRTENPLAAFAMGFGALD